MGGVKCEGDKPLLGQPLRIEASGLFLHATAGMDAEDRGIPAGLVEALRKIEVARHRELPCLKLTLRIVVR